MPRITYPYVSVENDASAAFPDGHTAWRPVADVSLASAGNITDTFLSVIDTGADYCVFPADYLEHLHVAEEFIRHAPVHGVTGGAGMKFAEVTLAVEKIGAWQATVCFSEHLRGQHVGFLGQMGFLERHVVTFDYQNRHCTLEVAE